MFEWLKNEWNYSFVVAWKPCVVDLSVIHFISKLWYLSYPSIKSSFCWRPPTWLNPEATVPWTPNIPTHPAVFICICTLTFLPERVSSSCFNVCILKLCWSLSFRLTGLQSHSNWRGLSKCKIHYTTQLQLTKCQTSGICLAVFKWRVNKSNSPWHSVGVNFEVARKCLNIVLLSGGDECRGAPSRMRSRSHHRVRDWTVSKRTHRLVFDKSMYCCSNIRATSKDFSFCNHFIPG